MEAALTPYHITPGQEPGGTVLLVWHKQGSPRFVRKEWLFVMLPPTRVPWLLQVPPSVTGRFGQKLKEAELPPLCGPRTAG